MAFYIAWGVDDQASPEQRLRDYCDVALGSMLAPYLVKYGGLPLSKIMTVGH
ncbi:hypothetical protein ACW2AB_04640 [Limosilactobacillus fermentum]